MSTQAQSGANEGAGANPVQPAGVTPSPAIGQPSPAPQAKPKEEEPKAKPKESEPAVKPKEKRVATLADDDEDLPEDTELYQMSKKALESRLARHTKRQLRERFGTDDLEAIAKDLKDVKVLREEKEERRKEQLTKEQRLEEERQSAIKERDEANARAQKLEDERDVSDVGGRYAALAEDFIAPKFLKKPAAREMLFKELAEHLHTKTSGDATKVTPAMVKDFWKDYAKENPEYSVKPPEVVNVPVNTGARSPGPADGKTAAGADGTAGKTARPGQPNSMTREEIKKVHGVRW